MAKAHPMEGKYFAFELGGNTARAGDLVICQVKKTKLHKVFDPDDVKELPEGMTSVDDAAVAFLKEAGATRIYTPPDGCVIRNKFLGFKLYWEKSRKESSPWKYHKPVTSSYWDGFFERVGIEVKILDEY